MMNKDKSPSFATRLLIGILLSPLFLLFSPFIIYSEIKEARVKRERGQIKARPFKPKQSDLIERLSIDTIEAREMVFDPLDAVPRLPFGHEHPAWVDFKAQLQENEELWSFEAEIESYLDEVYYCEGYAICSHDSNEIGDCFFVRCSTMKRRTPDCPPT